MLTQYYRISLQVSLCSTVKLSVFHPLMCCVFVSIKSFIAWCIRIICQIIWCLYKKAEMCWTLKAALCFSRLIKMILLSNEELILFFIFQVTPHIPNFLIYLGFLLSSFKLHGKKYNPGKLFITGSDSVEEWKATWSWAHRHRWKQGKLSTHFGCRKKALFMNFSGPHVLM